VTLHHLVVLICLVELSIDLKVDRASAVRRMFSIQKCTSFSRLTPNWPPNTSFKNISSISRTPTTLNPITRIKATYRLGANADAATKAPNWLLYYLITLTLIPSHTLVLTLELGFTPRTTKQYCPLISPSHIPVLGTPAWTATPRLRYGACPWYRLLAVTILAYFGSSLPRLRCLPPNLAVPFE